MTVSAAAVTAESTQTVSAAAVTAESTQAESVELTCTRGCAVHYFVPPHAIPLVLGGSCPSCQRGVLNLLDAPAAHARPRPASRARLDQSSSAGMKV